jgi:hypothetical protein
MLPASNEFEIVNAMRLYLDASESRGADRAALRIRQTGRRDVELMAGMGGRLPLAHL